MHIEIVKQNVRIFERISDKLFEEFPNKSLEKHPWRFSAEIIWKEFSIA